MDPKMAKQILQQGHNEWKFVYKKKLYKKKNFW